MITNARRTVKGSLIVTYNGRELFVPENSPGNIHWDQLQVWLAESDDNVITQET
ncbi:hypothetical protein SSBP1_gp45 [Synechococcus phage S-SBP1]|uniref:Uncharacterized protein n=1 Tax=Synechococcus phage S-SBP1 TaxID=2735125 RepID=A0A6M4EKS4_9CAUD|nr:hypothetical protein SSBP1_gp45 [Synechococcus phage S-SBP1]